MQAASGFHQWACHRRLSRYHIPTRYPDAYPGGAPGEHVGPDDATSALSDVDAIATFVVFGSVARGDFNLWSDVDVLVIAEHVADGWLERIVSMGEPPALVQPMVWTPAEWTEQLARNNAAALEAADRGIWLVGSAEQLNPRGR